MKVVVLLASLAASVSIAAAASGCFAPAIVTLGGAVLTLRNTNDSMETGDDGTGTCHWQGPTGDKGDIKGDKGDTGDTGDKGDPGARGTAAWLAGLGDSDGGESYSWMQDTEEAPSWATTGKGAKGGQGNTGQKGHTGDSGPNTDVTISSALTAFGTSLATGFGVGFIAGGAFTAAIKTYSSMVNKRNNR